MSSAEVAIEKMPPIQLVGQDEVLDKQIATAKNWPRDLTIFAQQLPQMVTLTEEDAGRCLYAYSRGGKIIVGPSIRFSECLQYCWKNSRIADAPIEIKEKTVVATAVFMDLENNTGIMRKAERKIVTKDGQRFQDDMIWVTGEAAKAIARRNARLDGIPRPFWSNAYDAVIQLIGDPRAIPTHSRPAALAWFEKRGMTVQQVCAVVHVDKPEDIWVNQIVELRGIRTALEEETITIDEIMRGAKRMVSMPKALKGKPAKKARAPKAATAQAPAAATPAATKGPIMETEYVDPKKSECKECGASFGVHLIKCSKFKAPVKGKITQDQHRDLILWLGEHQMDATHAAKIARSLGHSGSLKELPAALYPKVFQELEKVAHG